MFLDTRMSGCLSDASSVLDQYLSVHYLLIAAVCNSLVMRGEKVEEDSVGGCRRLEMLQMLAAMNPKDALSVRALCVSFHSLSLRVCVGCVCVCVCVCMYVCVCVFVSAWFQMCLYSCLHVCMCAKLYFLLNKAQAMDVSEYLADFCQSSVKKKKKSKNLL